MAASSDPVDSTDPARRPCRGLSRFAPEAFAALIAFACLFFFTQAVPLYDTDYAHWLEPAREIGWGRWAVALTVPPWTRLEAMNRPFIALWFKGFDAIGRGGFGGAVAAKCAVVALFLALYYGLLRRRLGAAPALGAFLFLAVSSPALASVMWHSDFAMIGQGFVFLALWSSLRAVECDDAGGRRAVALWSLLAFAATALAIKTKPGGQLFPPALFLFLLIRRPRSLRRLWPLPAALIVYEVPWFAWWRGIGSRSILDQAARPWWEYQSPSWSGWMRMTFGFGDMAKPSQLSAPPDSMLGYLLIPLIALGAGLAIWAIGRGKGVHRPAADSNESTAQPRQSGPIDLIVFLAALGLIQWLSYSGYPRQEGFFRARYLMESAPALAPLLFLALISVWRRALGDRAAWVALAATLALHCGVHAIHCRQYRENQGSYQIAMEGLHRAMHVELAPARFMLAMDLPKLGYYPTHPRTHAIYLREQQGPVMIPGDGLPLYIVQQDEQASEGFILRRRIPGAGSSFYDGLFHRDPERNPPRHNIYIFAQE